MKKITFLSLLFVLVSFTNPMKAQPSAKLLDLLFEFEQNTTWDAVEERWKDVRTDWGTAAASCNDAACIGLRLLEFESHVKWAAVVEQWSKRRDAWVKECQNVKKMADAARLMVELESNIKWAAVSEQWKLRREGWLKEAMAIN